MLTRWTFWLARASAERWCILQQFVILSGLAVRTFSTEDYTSTLGCCSCRNRLVEIREAHNETKNKLADRYSCSPAVSKVPPGHPCPSIGPSAYLSPCSLFSFLLFFFHDFFSFSCVFPFCRSPFPLPFVFFRFSFVSCIAIFAFLRFLALIGGFC